MWRSFGSRQAKGGKLIGATIYYLIVNVESIFSSTGVTVINNLEFKMHIFTLNVELIIELYAPYVRAPLSRLFSLSADGHDRLFPRFFLIG